METWAIFVLALVALSNLSVAVVGYLGANGSLRRNNIAGIRTDLTVANDKAWYVANSAGGPAITIGAVAGLLAMILPIAVIGLSDIGVIVAAILAVALMLVGVIIGSVQGHRAARIVLSTRA